MNNLQTAGAIMCYFSVVIGCFCFLYYFLDKLFDKFGWAMGAFIIINVGFFGGCLLMLLG